jgi:hypothetical protein
VPPLPAEPPGSNTIVPAIGELALCGVQVIWPAEAQYEYLLVPSMLISVPEVAQFPWVDGSGEMNPAVPLWFTVPEHMHPPSALVVHVIAEYPIAEMRPPAMSQLTGVDEMTRQDLSSGNSTCPVVVVLSA